jgi:hypothetical protein
MFIEENAADMDPYFSWALGGRTHRHAPEPGLRARLTAATTSARAAAASGSAAATTTPAIAAALR